MPVQPSAIDSIGMRATTFSADSLAFAGDSLRLDSLSVDSLAIDSLAVNTTAVDTLQQTVTIEPLRYEGIPRKESFASQSSVTLLLLLQFFLLAFSFQVIIKKSVLLFKSFNSSLDVSHPKSLFTGGELIQSFLLLAFACINLGLLFYLFFSGQATLRWLDFLPILLGFLLLFFFKNMMCRLLGYVFFDKKLAIFWIESNFHIYILVNILIFPMLVWVLYFQASGLYLLYTAIVGAIIGFALATYRLLMIFPIRLYSSFQIILYLCALEIAPVLLLFFVLKQLQIFT
jgi:hypothetical protein